MAVFETYSKRQKRIAGDVIDVYSYDVISPKLRTQIIHIIHDVIGNNENHSLVQNMYADIVGTLRREYGVFKLPPTTSDYTSSQKELISFFIIQADTNECLDLIEIVFLVADLVIRDEDHIHGYMGGARKADEAIKELNDRFKENGVGFQYVDKHIVRVDSELIHVEAVKPALTLLNTKEYKGPHEEFINAYEHYKSGNNKEALNDCLKAFESTMKAICDKRGWTYDPTKDTAKKLIDILFDNGLIASFWQTQFASLRSLLESSVPTGRNKMAGHGQGATPTAVPNEITAYMLHMTASTLVFLTTAEKALP